jgi:hypothetical protein
MIIDGLWTADPLNPLTVTGNRGLTQSRVLIPAQPKAPSILEAPSGSLRFTYNASPGEIVTVAGSFNGWDPFMYEMKETSSGLYTLTLPLPPGIYQYSFFYRGERIADPYNPYKVYTTSGIAVSQVAVQ